MSDSLDNINNKNFGSDDSSFMPTPEKFQAEQDALKKIHDPKDFSEVKPRNGYEDLEDLYEKKTEKHKLAENIEKQDITPNNIAQPEQKQQNLEDNIKNMEQQLPKELKNEVVPDRLLSEEDNAAFVSSDEIVLDFTEKPELPQKEQIQKPINNEYITKGSYTPKQPPKTSNDTVKKKVKFVKSLNEDESMFCGLCHLCNVLIVTAIWVPFFLYLTRSENEKVAFHSIQSILYGAAVIVIVLILGALSSFTSSMCGCMVFLIIPLAFLLYLAFWICSIYFSIETFRGFDYKIPYISLAAEKVVEFLTFEE